MGADEPRSGERIDVDQPGITRIGEHRPQPAMCPPLLAEPFQSQRHVDVAELKRPVTLSKRFDLLPVANVRRLLSAWLEVQPALSPSGHRFIAPPAAAASHIRLSRSAGFFRLTL
jgi:hypothetical protein